MYIEDELKQALRAEDPGAAFTQRVLARAREERSRAAGAAPSPATNLAAGNATFAETPAIADGVDRETRGAETGAATLTPGPTLTPIVTRPAARSASNARRLIAALAASLALTAAGMQYWRHTQYVAEGERARAQVLTALRLTSEKLNKVHDAITESTEAR